MAVAAGLPPPLIAELPARDYGALEAALDRRWGPTEEGLATLCDLVHLLLLVEVQRGGGKGWRWTPIPRPTASSSTRRRRPASAGGPRNGKPGVQTGQALLAALGGAGPVRSER
jgi:hypothetical protein